MAASAPFLARPFTCFTLVSIAAALALPLGGCTDTALPQEDVSMTQPDTSVSENPTLPPVETSTPSTNVRPTEQVFDESMIPPEPRPAPPPPPQQAVAPPPPPPPGTQPPQPVASECEPCHDFDARIWWVNERIINLQNSDVSLRLNANLSDPNIQRALADDAAQMKDYRAQLADLEAQRDKCPKHCLEPTQAGTQPPPPPPPPAPATQTSAAPPPRYWYWCDANQKYFGEVETCNTNWREVPMQPGIGLQVDYRYTYHCDRPAGDYPALPACTVPWRLMSNVAPPVLVDAPAAAPAAPASVVPAIGYIIRFDVGGGGRDRDHER